MWRGIRNGWAIAAILLLAGCGVLIRVLSIPIMLVQGVGSLFAWILVGDAGVDGEAELRASGLRIERRVVEIEVADDSTYRGTVEETRRIESPVGLQNGQFESVLFSPESQQVVLESASVEMPDGRTEVVDPAQAFTQPSPAAQLTPEFVSSSATTVVFPQLVVGARIHVRWRFEERGRSVFGFHYSWRPPLTTPVDEAVVRITAPAAPSMRHAGRDGFAVSESALPGGLRRIEATLRRFAGLAPERSMVSPRDVCPLFVASTLATWEEIGARFHDAIGERIEVTPEIVDVAEQVAAGTSGLECARRLTRWVASNVHYVKVYLQQMDGWVPHYAGEVLRRRYGDCKDQVVLLSALLRAKGIAAEPALVDLERAWRPLPLPTPAQFNHCMLYLPEFDQWANPTDPWLDLGELDIALSDKCVVLAVPGGRTGRTPAGDARANRCSATHEIELDAKGRLHGRTVLEASGRPAGRLRELLVRAGTAEAAADDLLFENSLLATGRLECDAPADLGVPLRCEGEFVEDVGLALEPTIHFQLPTGLDVANPARLRRLFDGRTRTSPLVAGAVTISSRRTIRLPPGYTLDRIPPDRDVSTAAATYRLRCRQAAPDRLEVDSEVCIAKDRYSPDEYVELERILEAFAADLRVILVASRSVAE